MSAMRAGPRRAPPAHQQLRGAAGEAAVHPEQPAGDSAVLARMRRALAAVALARASEAALVGAGTCALVLAAVVVSGAPSGSPAAWVAALGTGALAAASWWLELRPRAAGLVRRIDRRLAFGGALLTAYEAELRGSRSPLSRELSRRVAARLPLRDALRAALPSSLAVAAIPLAALALLALAGQRAREASPAVGLRTVTGVALSELEELAAHLGRHEDVLSPEELAALTGLAAKARLKGLSGAPLAAEERAELLEAAARELAELGRRLPAGAEDLRGRLERAELATAAARDALAEHGLARPPRADPRGADPSDAGEHGAGEHGSAGPEGDGRGTPAADPSAPELAAGPAAPDAAPATADELGIPTGRWWPPRDDGLVERWVEARRLAGAPR